MMTELVEDQKSIRVADARAAVQASGLLAGLEGPHFLSPSSGDWLPYFKPGDGVTRPDFARVIITRAGQAPREVVISWDEYEAEIEDERAQEWARGRLLKPMSIFGAEVERHAYRVAFADVLEPLVAALRGEAGVRANTGESMRDPVAVAVDWIAELAHAVTPQDLDRLWSEASAAKALTDPVLADAFTVRLTELEAKTVAPPAEVKPKPAGPSPLSVAATAKPLTATPPRVHSRGPRKRNRPRRNLTYPVA